MKKYIIFGVVLSFQLLYLSTNLKSGTPSTYIGGIILNAETKHLKINNQSVPIQKNGSFEHRFSLEKSTYIPFKIKEEIDLFLEPGDSLSITLDANGFYKTFKISGKGERINQFLIQDAIRNKEVENYFNQHYREIFALQEDAYVAKMDSLKITFENQLAAFVKDNPNTNDFFIRTQKAMIQYRIAELLLRYPNWHRQFTGNADFKPTEQFHRYLDHLDFNDPELLAVDEYRSFLERYVAIRAEEELKKNQEYKNKNYKWFRAKFDITLQTFTDPTVKNEMLYFIMEPFFDWSSFKGANDLIARFRAHCTNGEYLAKTEEMVERDKAIQKQCEIRIFKTVNNTTLDAYIYRPSDMKPGEKRAAFAFFHGGGWDVGKPEWGHEQCQHFSSLGLVTISFEYRLRAQHDATPVECIADAKSAIRWMRIHAEELGIDPERIAVSGFSAGGHLALCTAMIDKFDEPEEDHHISSAANALMLWATPVKITEDGWFKRILQADVKDCDPASHIRTELPPAIIFHGTDDELIPLWTIEQFAQKMGEAGNRCELHIYEGQTHLSWGENRKNVLNKMEEFLESLDYIQTHDE